MTMEEKYDAYYLPLVKKYAAQLEECGLDFSGIPSLFLPAWGKHYSKALVKIAVIGKETYGWGQLTNFIAAVKNETFKTIDDRIEFQNLDFKSWLGGTKNRATFWGFWMNILAKTYGVADWNTIKRGEHDILLDSFVWGNANAIETWASQGIDKKMVNQKAHQYAYVAARPFNTLKHIQELFHPDVVILTCSLGEQKQYLSEMTVEQIHNEKYPNVSVWKTGKTFVFSMPHPNNQKFTPGGSDIYAQQVRELLIEYKKFMPLPTFGTQTTLTPVLRQYIGEQCADKNRFEVIATIAKELRKQNCAMQAKLACELLNDLGIKSDAGTDYTGNKRGPCRLISTAWSYYKDTTKEVDIADNIALAFTKVNGSYAYS